MPSTIEVFSNKARLSDQLLGVLLEVGNKVEGEVVNSVT